MKYKGRFFLPIILTSIGIISLGNVDWRNDKSLSWMPQNFPNESTSLKDINIWLEACYDAIDKRYSLGPGDLSDGNKLERNEHGMPKTLSGIVGYRVRQCEQIVNSFPKVQRERVSNIRKLL